MLICTSSGFVQVEPSKLNILVLDSDKIGISKNGYLFVYVSNETPNYDVYFDNLQVTHERSALLEETHYYPFGLTMAGISSKAINRLQNLKKFNGIEEINDFGLQDLDTKFRELDPQIGRWWQIDPKTEKMEMWSPYVSNYNNPIRFNDPDGDEPYSGDDPSKLFGATVDMTKAPAGSGTNAAGYPRNGRWFWKEMLAQHPEMFDKGNAVRIMANSAPVVNETWVKYNPAHAEYMGDKLIHHHINQGKMATGIPQTAHRTLSSVLHSQNPGGRTKPSTPSNGIVAEKPLPKIGGLTLTPVVQRSSLLTRGLAGLSKVASRVAPFLVVVDAYFTAERAKEAQKNGKLTEFIILEVGSRIKDIPMIGAMAPSNMASIISLANKIF